jgi:hypothetical protein
MSSEDDQKSTPPPAQDLVEVAAPATPAADVPTPPPPLPIRSMQTMSDIRALRACTDDLQLKGSFTVNDLKVLLPAYERLEKSVTPEPMSREELEDIATLLRGICVGCNKGKMSMSEGKKIIDVYTRLEILVTQQ